MSRLSVIALLVGCASAQRVCMDDANFLPDHPFVTPYGPSGTCGQWRDDFFPTVTDTVEKCMAQVTLAIDGVPGTTNMVALQIQEFMATPYNSAGAGCCGDSTSGSACSQFKEEMTMPPCDGELYEEDGMCLPCYNTLIDGACSGCWGADAEMCTRDECTPDIGYWDDYEGKCRVCNTVSVDRCDETHCEDIGATWDEDWSYCKPCRWRDVEGCSEQGCREFDEGVWWAAEPDWGTPAQCRWCQPEIGVADNCDESSCMAANSSGYNWGCDGEWCRCRRCSFENYEWDNCAEHECVPTATAMDVKWVPAQWEGDTGSCQRCFMSEGGFDHDTYGCDEAACTAVDGFEWNPVFAYCDVCHPEDTWGCPSQMPCEAAGGYWCTADGSSHCTTEEQCGCSEANVYSCWSQSDCEMAGGQWCYGGDYDYCMTVYDGCPQPAPPPGGQCHWSELPQARMDMARMKGFQPRSPRDC